MGDIVVKGEFDTLGVDHNKLKLSWRIPVKKRYDNRVNGD